MLLFWRQEKGFVPHWWEPSAQPTVQLVPLQPTVAVPITGVGHGPQLIPQEFGSMLSRHTGAATVPQLW